MLVFAHTKYKKKCFLKKGKFRIFYEKFLF